MRNDRARPKTVSEIIGDVLGTVFVVILFVTVLAGAVLLVLSPGIIINWMRGRYKGRPEGVIKASVRDWQTWLISLPIAATVFFVLNISGVFSEPASLAKPHPSSGATSTDFDSKNNDERNKLRSKIPASADIGVRSAVPTYIQTPPLTPYVFPSAKAAEKKPVHQISKEEWMKLHQEP